MMQNWRPNIQRGFPPPTQNITHKEREKTKETSKQSCFLYEIDDTAQAVMDDKCQTTRASLESIEIFSLC